MAKVRQNMIEKTRYFTYMILSVWKVLVFFCATWMIVSLNGILQEPSNIFDKYEIYLKGIFSLIYIFFSFCLN